MSTFQIHTLQTRSSDLPF